MAKINTAKGPDPKSIRSKKRANRGFTSVERSTRKGRRAARRLAEQCSLDGKLVKPGDKAEVKCGSSTWTHTGGGRVRHY